MENNNKEKLIKYYKIKLKEKEKELKKAVIIDSSINLFSSLLSILVVILAIVVMVYTLIASRNLSDLRKSIITEAPLLKDAFQGSANIKIAVNITIITSSFIIVSIYIPFFNLF